MAAEPFYFTGYSYEGKGNKAHPITLRGFCGNPNLEVGGGPVIPPPPDPFPEPPPDNIVIKPAPDTGGWGYIAPEPGWYYVPGAGDPGPK